MTLVMDGVRRSMVVRSSMTVVAPRPVRTVAAVQPTPAGLRYVTGLDGIRRPMRVSTPRQVLEQFTEPVALATSLAPGATANRTWNTRPVIAFGLVAAALVASGSAALWVNGRQGATARADQPAMRMTQKLTPTPTVPAVPATAARQAELQQLVDTFTASQPANTFGIVVKDLSTGATATSSADRQLTSASLYKLFVAQQIYRLVDTGQLTYGTAAGGGTGRNIEDCLQVMINISDNDCGRALGDILGWGKQNDALHNAGYTATDLTNPQQTSARDVATLLGRLYNGTLNSPSSNDRFLGLLKDQRVNNRLPIGLPAGTTIAHKTGDLDNYVHDAGIVYGAKTNYLVVVMSGPWGSPGNAPAQFATLSSQLWHFFED